MAWGQPLYDLVLQDAEGARLVRFGIRTVEWNRGSDGFGQAMQCVVNGVPVQGPRANVIPPDFFPFAPKGGESGHRRCGGGPHEYDPHLGRGALWRRGAVRPLRPARHSRLAGLHECVRHGAHRCRVAGEFLGRSPGASASVAEPDVIGHLGGNNETEKAWREWGWQDLYDLHGVDSIVVEDAYRQLFERNCRGWWLSLGEANTNRLRPTI